MRIHYRKSYKYQLAGHYHLQLAIKPDAEVRTDFIYLTSNGYLIIKKGYAWDGPSGPAIDTANFMRGSLVHDALYQLMREKHLQMKHRKFADELMHAICKEDGMSSLRAWWVLAGVRGFGESSANPKNKKEILKAPK